MIRLLVIGPRSTLDIQISRTEHLCGDDQQQFLEKKTDYSWDIPVE